MADRDVIADVDSEFSFHAMEDAVVLNVGVVADAYLVDVAAEDGVHPDAGVFADDNVSDELGGVVDVGGFGELGCDAFVGADHVFIRCWKSSGGHHHFAKHAEGMSARSMKSQHITPGAVLER
jgi:hypothetical protein